MRISSRDMDSRVATQRANQPGNRTPGSTIHLYAALVLLAAGCLTYLSSTVLAQDLPKTHGETLTGKKIDFPDAIVGTPVVCVFAFSHEAGGKIRAWADPLSKGAALPAGTILWTVANVEGSPSLVHGMIRGGMRKSTPQPEWEHAVLMTSNSKAWQQSLHVTNEKVPMVVIFDATGHVTWSHEGLFDNAGLDELRSHLAAGAPQSAPASTPPQ